jgi:hypothetical protein
MSPHRKRITTGTSRGDTPGAGTLCRALVVVDVLLLIGVVLAFTFPSRSAAPASPARPSQTGTFAYHADVPVSDAYPTGELATGDPVFINLLTAVAVSFHYATDAPSTSVRGTVRLDLSVSAPSGWHTGLPLVPPTALVAGTLDVTGDVDLHRILALADRVAAATGVGDGAPLDVTVTASALVSVDGAEAVAFTSQLPFRLTPLTLTLSGVKPSESPRGPVVSSTTALETTTHPTVRRSGAVPKQLGLVLLAALLLFGAATLVLWPASGRSTPAGRDPQEA